MSCASSRLHPRHQRIVAQHAGDNTGSRIKGVRGAGNTGSLAANQHGGGVWAKRAASSQHRGSVAAHHRQVDLRFDLACAIEQAQGCWAIIARCPHEWPGSLGRRGKPCQPGQQFRREPATVGVPRQAMRTSPAPRQANQAAHHTAGGFLGEARSGCAQNIARCSCDHRPHSARSLAQPIGKPNTANPPLRSQKLRKAPHKLWWVSLKYKQPAAGVPR